MQHPCLRKCLLKITHFAGVHTSIQIHQTFRIFTFMAIIIQTIYTTLITANTTETLDRSHEPISPTKLEKNTKVSYSSVSALFS